MKLSFHGAARSVTGSRHMLEVPGFKLLLDCGLFQGRRDEAYRKNRDLGFDPKSLSAVLLSHAHIDHSAYGRREPKREAPEGKASSRAYPRPETCRRVGRRADFRCAHSASGADRQIQRAFGQCGSPGSFGVRAIQPSPSKVILVHGEENSPLWLWPFRRNIPGLRSQFPMSVRPLRFNSTALLAILLLILTGCICIAPVVPAQAGSDEPRARARALGIVVGSYEPGPLNTITDVAGVSVGQTTLISGEGSLKPGIGPVRTGVTVVIPRNDVWHKKVSAGSFVLNGTGEMTGLSWVTESGFLEYPIALTNTLNVPRVANGVMSWMIARYPEIGITDDTLTPVVAECDDGRLNDIQGRHVSEADVAQALDSASSGVVQEGTVGAGTGMVSYGFKGGIGTASRRLPETEGGYTIGVLVNANHGRRPELVVSGIPVGRLYEPVRFRLAGSLPRTKRRLDHRDYCHRCSPR